MKFDFRLIENGLEIPSENYSDQPYMIRADDGAWVCAMTTGSGGEGASGQHIVVRRSTDMGHTWGAPIALEPEDGPEASYSVLLKTTFGRIYCFYNHNTDNIRELLADENGGTDNGLVTRVDSQGHYVYRYSDDNGLTWSKDRYDIPLRTTEIDRENPYSGKIKFFWNVGKAFSLNGSGYVPLHKVGRYGVGFFARSEGVLLRSTNILEERDAGKLQWETLPDGDIGVRAPADGGPVAEEHSFVPLSDGSIFVVYRTISGHPGCAYSRDGGRSFSEPQYLQYDNGTLVNHPRAANFVWRLSNGKFLYWFHNNSNRWYDERNPVWVLIGEEISGLNGKELRWGQPEILLYDDDSFVRISYPDLLEDQGRYYISETEKNYARVHEIPGEFLDTLFRQFTLKQVAHESLALEKDGPFTEFDMPQLPPFYTRDMSDASYHGKDTRDGFTVEMWMEGEPKTGEPLIDTRASDNAGLHIWYRGNGIISISMSDGRYKCCWDSDALCHPDKGNHVAVIVDGGPKIIEFVTNGILNDGREIRPFGFGRFSGIHDCAGIERKRDAVLDHWTGIKWEKKYAKASGHIRKLRIYTRALMVTEIIGNYRAGL